MDGDEGIVLQGAQRVLEGQVPYRDFFTFYTPGPYYLTALLFRIFGSSLAIARIELVVCALVFSVLTFFIARRVCSRGTALLAVYCSTVTCLPARFMVTHWDSTLFAYVALYAGIRWIETNRRAWALATGFFAAITFLFEQSAGVGVAAGVVAGLTILAARGQLRSLGRNIGPALVGFATPFFATFGYFAWQHSLFLMIGDWLWPTLHYSSANHTPYGYTAALVKQADFWASGWTTRIVSVLVIGPLFTIPILPIVATAVLVYLSVTGAQNRCSVRWKYYVFTSAFIFGAIVSVLLVRRPDFVHIDYLAPVFYIALAWVAESRPPKFWMWKSLAPIVLAYVSVSSTAFGLATLTGALHAGQHLQTVRGAIRIDNKDHSLDYVQQRVRAGDKMFIYPYQPLYYYLTGTFSPTRFDFLQPGMHTPEQFDESEHALAADQTRVVLLETTFDQRLAWVSPNAPMHLFAARDPVEEYIRQHYRACGTPLGNDFWTFLFMVPNEAPCPAPLNSPDLRGSAK